jgi:RNA polymerase sigma factor (TIGR02999 family)
VRRSAESVTQLLAKWREGDQEALQALIPLVYHELRSLAHRYLRAERPGHTLQSTALVHEAFLRLVDQSPAQFQNRAHFLGVAAKLMRQVLVDYARRRHAAKRGPEYKVELDGSFEVAHEQARGVDVLAVDDALLQLSRRDEQQGRIVEMRFFGGLTVEETAKALEVSPATVKRNWNMAKAWLTREMQRGGGGKNEAMGEG